MSIMFIIYNTMYITYYEYVYSYILDTIVGAGTTAVIKIMSLQGL